MGKYQTYSRKDNLRDREVRIHPVWRGIGFALIILTPIIAYAAMMVLVEANTQNGWVTIPPDLVAPGSDSLLYVKIILVIVLMFLLYALFSLITFILYGLFGPSRYGPLDVPPEVYRGRRYKR